ncbi:TonB-dependent receptor [Paracidovorax anthurii]|uniref:Iron complex outermembrane receptor protein n=1 Tax=Paracidovorax anthurii TaxID=78229 RepID=A0A328ZJH1_9BURK|nr:TonB-dependent siderophore receptor [Paracidovorax anthurii]RAR86041.1 iron complex outermembrane receptor protein [Paracidovorax anthurii]
MQFPFRKRRLMVALSMAAGLPAGAWAPMALAQSGEGTVVQQLPSVTVSGAADAKPDDTPRSYAGGQVARGARLGLLGNVDMMDAPFNATSYTSELMQNQQARSLSDVMANAPGVDAGGPWYFDNFFIRGFAVNRAEIGFNGLYGIASSEGAQLEGVDRVEVLKGPSTLINGSSPRGTAGGTINLVPKRASDTPLNRVGFNYLSDGNVGVNADIGRRFGKDNAFGVRLNAAHRDGDSSIDHEKQRATNLALGLDYQGERLRASADVGASSQKITGAKSNFFVSAAELPKAPPGNTNVWPTWSYQDKEHTFGMVRAEYDVTDALSVGGAFGAAETRRKMNTPFGVLQNAAGDISFFPSALEEKNRTHSGELNARLRFHTGQIKHNAVFALTDYHSKISNYQPQTNYSAASNLYNPANLPEPVGLDFNRALTPLSSMQLRSYAVTDTLSALNDRVMLTMGMRHQQIDVNAYNWQTGAFESNYKKSANTPSAGLVIKPRDNLSLYANYVEALSQGDVAPTTAVNANEVFAPFVSRQLEVGTKIDWGDFTTTLSVFQIKRPSGFLGTNNVYSLAGEQRNRGVELQVFGEPVRGFRLLGGAAWTRAILTETPNGQYNGNKAAGVPTWSIKLGGELDIPQVQGLTTTARMLHASSIPFNAANTATVPSWTRFDVGARYATKISSRSVVFRATIENLFNRRYWDTSPSYQTVTYAAPRTYMLSASVDF